MRISEIDDCLNEIRNAHQDCNVLGISINNKNIEVYFENTKGVLLTCKKNYINCEVEE